MAEADTSTSAADQSSTTSTQTGSEGGAQTGAAAATTSGGQTAAEAAGTSAAGIGDEAPWFTALPADLAKDRNITKYESPEALARAHVNALKRFGKDPARLVEIPEKPEDAEGWNRLFEALGRPKSPEDYGVTLPDTASEGDRAFVKQFTEKAHAAGASTSVIAAAVETLNAATEAARTEALAAREAETAATIATLKKDWGDRYDHYAKAIGKAIVDFGDADGGEGGGQALIDALNERGLGNVPGFNKLLAHFIDKAAEPEGLPGQGAGAGGGPLTPYQAVAKLAELQADPAKRKALEDRNDPMHAAVLADRQNLLKAAYPNDQRTK